MEPCIVGDDLSVSLEQKALFLKEIMNWRLEKAAFKLKDYCGGGEGVLDDGGEITQGRGQSHGN